MKRKRHTDEQIAWSRSSFTAGPWSTPGPLNGNSRRRFTGPEAPGRRRLCGRDDSFGRFLAPYGIFTGFFALNIRCHRFAAGGIQGNWVLQLDVSPDSKPSVKMELGLVNWKTLPLRSIT